MANKIATLEINLLDDGTVTVGGPLEQRMLCYGMLEAAKDVVRDYGTKKENLILPASLGATLGLAKKGGV